MRALFLDAAGPDALDKLRVADDQSAPEPGDDQLRIRVSNFDLNPVDYKMAESGMFIDKFPTILGCDVAGTVEKVGANLTGKFKEGDQVFGMPRTGAFCDQTVADGKFVRPVPKGLTNEQAAGIPVGALTAMSCLFHGTNEPQPTDAPVDGSRTVLIWGAASSVGTYAVQIAALRGYHVIGVCSAKSAELVKSLGAAATADYHSATVLDDIKAAAGGRKITLACDFVGAETATQAASVLATDVPTVISWISAEPTKTHENTKVNGVLLASAYGDAAYAAEVERYFDFVCKHLAEGKIKPQDVHSLKGLDSVSKGLKMLHKSATGSSKIVVSLE